MSITKSCHLAFILQSTLTGCPIVMYSACFWAIFLAVFLLPVPVPRFCGFWDLTLLLMTFHSLLENFHWCRQQILVQLFRKQVDILGPVLQSQESRCKMYEENWRRPFSILLLASVQNVSMSAPLLLCTNHQAGMLCIMGIFIHSIIFMPNLKP